MAKKKELNVETVQELADEYKDKETFSGKDMIKLMRKSGLSYKQLMQGMKAIAEETDRIAAEAEARGEKFDKKEFLKQQLNDALGKGNKKK